MMTNTPRPISYSTADAAAMLGVSRSTLYRLMAAGELGYATIGGRRLIPTTALLDLVERNTVVDTPEA